MKRSRCRIRFGVAVGLLAAVPASVLAASGPGERDVPASRYTLRDAALDLRGGPSASGRFRLDGVASVRSDADTRAVSARYGASAKLVAVADCSGYVFADGFE